MSYTLMKNSSGGFILCGGPNRCTNVSILEFSGFCERCWIKLTPAERAILQGKEPPVEKVVTHETIVNHYPPKPHILVRIMVLALQTLIATVAAVCWLNFRK